METGRTGVTFEDFHDWLDSKTHAEWVNGVIILMPPVSVTHARIVSFLRILLDVAVERGRGEVFAAPFLMRLRDVESARSPDVFFVPAERAALVKHTYLDGPADVAIEVVSPGTTEIDRREKFTEYARAGVREYWLIDPLHQTAEFYERATDGRYRLVPLDTGDVFRWRGVDGFYLRLEWLWQNPMPEIPDVARELGVW